MTASTEVPTLHPAESMALTVARARLERGDPVEPNTAAVCVAALARIVGKPIEGWPL